MQWKKSHDIISRIDTDSQTNRRRHFTIAYFTLRFAERRTV